ncbi:MAG: choice-of-anchor Q domain-containing protein [Rudaea sp.]|uniref:choice-of-anchor Q domain-containing protein n=1 Tax=Rudaea sp. TaxID=2136325 RepID=UPI0039E45DC4
MLRFVLLMSLVFGVCQTAVAGIVRVADGDCTALSKAVSDAGTSAQSVSITLARAGTYSSCDISLATGSVDIDAQGATLQALTAMIALPATLSIRNAILTGASPGTKVNSHCAYPIDMGTIYAGEVICNLGTLMLDHITVQNWSSEQNCTTEGFSGFCVVDAWVSSSGFAVLRNVTQTGFTSAPNTLGITFIANSGNLEIYNSTFSNASSSGWVITSYTNQTDSSAALKIANSLFVGGDGAALCLPVGPATSLGGSVTSLGGNVATDSSCGLSAANGDKIDTSLSLPAAADHGGLVPTVQIGYGNPAYRAGVAQYCEATDARGVVRNAANCDAGAYESGGGLGLVTENGMNGLYYVPGIANGHYVSVQRIHDNSDVMVFWNTFDRNGNQAWLYGVGTLTSDRHIHAQMARNTGGVLQPGGAPTGAKSSSWGTVDIDVSNCSAAQFAYQSNLPEFGSGQFPLTRLAFESAINCGD